MKGQAWSLDFSFSIVIFTSIAIIFLFTFNILSGDASKSSSISDMQHTALEVSEALVRTRGYPLNWNIANVKSIGLLGSDDRISDLKVRRLLDMDYNTSKSRLGVWGYEYQINIVHPNGTLFNNKTTNYTKGPAIGSRNDALHVERYILLNKQPGRLQLILWR